MPEPRRVLAMAQKELYHILRDPRTLVILFLMPLLQLIIFGYAMNMEIRDVPLAIEDQARNQASHKLIERFGSTSYFKLLPLPQWSDGPEALFRSRSALAYMTIPKGFMESNPDLLFVIDASDPNSAQMIQSYATGIVNAMTTGTETKIDLRPMVMFNPDLKSSFFFVPGLIAMILVMVCALLTSISISREKELGTMEQILVSPVSATEILLGKVMPYIALGLMDGLVILGVGMLLFRVPFRGEFTVFLGFTFLYVLTALCIGLLVSTLAKTQQAAMMMALAITLLPTILLSGFMFPIASMPPILQKITYIVPARYYLQIIRGIMLKGNTIAQLYQSGFILAGMSAGMLVLASRRFKLRLG
ncbi:MAG TPA: ABC transporter permease [Candidatus Cloacimonadota bacterium]|nr:ABC transporter permease [Candidatus Cloacimonadota bacterium]